MALHFSSTHLPVITASIQTVIDEETGSSQDCLPEITYDLKSTTGSKHEDGTWKVSFAVSHALHPEVQHFKQDDPRTSHQMKPDFHCTDLKDPPPLKKKPCASESSLTPVYPKLARG